MFSPRLVHGALTFWMQTTGVSLLAVKWCGLARVLVPVRDSRSAYGLLYLPAVRATGASKDTPRHRDDLVPGPLRSGATGYLLFGSVVQLVVLNERGDGDAKHVGSADLLELR